MREKVALMPSPRSGGLTFVGNANARSDWARASAIHEVCDGDDTRIAIARNEPSRTEQKNSRDALCGLISEAVPRTGGVKTLRAVATNLTCASTRHTVAP